LLRVQAYVIGAFVDKNRHKGLTARKAAELGIPTARLPINEFVALTGCTVMTTLHGEGRPCRF
jgi:tRNA (guanine9-N1)-methyltransferase